MSWIQNFFERFKKEEEAVQHEIHTKKQIKLDHRQQSANKDLDARITYQYPKGQFRFPVIPDDKPIRRNKGEVHRKKDIDHSNEQPEKQKQSKQRDHSNKEQIKRIQKEAARVKETPKVNFHSSGPFRPTDIPSPIFGFNRPKKTAIEYELSQFATNKNYPDPAVLDDHESVIAASNEKEGILGEIKNHDHKPEGLKKIEGEDFIKNGERLKLGFSEKDDSLERLLIRINADEANEIEQKNIESEAALAETAVSMAAEEVIIGSYDTIQRYGLVENEDVTPIENRDALEIEENNSIENFEAVKMKDENSIENCDAVENEDNNSIGNNDEAESEVNTSEQNMDTLMGGENSSVNSINTNETHTEAGLLPEGTFSDDDEDRTAAQTNQIEPEQPKRRHLPFNVMMLKQDKQKWEEKKVYQIKEQHMPSQPAISEPIKKAVPEEEPSSKEKDTNFEEGIYQFPDFQLLNPPIVADMDTEWLREQEDLLNQTLENFNVGAKVVNLTQGPSVTRFEVQPEPGVKVNKVTNLTDDIKLSLAARDIRIEAPIPGKHTIGIEVPNQKSRPVQISEIIQSSVFRESVSPLTAVLGLDISGKPIVTDLKKMPHGLIAGATGSGKSVCINTILVSLLYKASPDDLKLLLIDPKMVELAPYNRIPHLVSPVITDVKAATASLKWAVEEMERRYELFAHTGVRDINRFNELAMQHKKYSEKLPFIVIVIDELADLMMMSPADVEEAICRIAQKARACGIHLIIATQRPSVDVITGLIKANIPTRIAFSVSSQVDSRTIIDISGAEKLLGRGDMLFLENGSSKPVRLQGTFVSDEEIDIVVAHVREQREPDYLFEQEELLKKAQVSEEEDELFYEACEFVVDQASASTSSLQRRFKIGYNRAARLMEMMEQQGYISSAKGSKPRDVYITAADLETIQETGI